MIELVHYSTLSQPLRNLPRSILLFCCLSASVAAAADLRPSIITEDFGSYSNDTEDQLRQKLTQLGDFTDSTQNLNDGIRNFYQRTGLTYSSDPIQQILDIDLVRSAEREVKRVLGDDSSAATEQMLAYVNSIAPWLNQPTVEETPPVNDMLAEQSALTTAISKLDNTLNNLTNTIKLLY